MLHKKTGNARLLDLALATMPTYDKAAELSDTIQKQKHIMQSGLFRFAEEETQQIVNECFKNLKLMHAGEAPKMPKNAKGEAQKFYSAFAFFCRDKDEFNVVRTGKEAFEEKFSKLDQIKDFDALEPLVVFGWLGSFNQQRAVQKKKAELIKGICEEDTLPMDGGPAPVENAIEDTKDATMIPVEKTADGVAPPSSSAAPKALIL